MLRVSSKVNVASCHQMVINLQLWNRAVILRSGASQMTTDLTTTVLRPSCPVICFEELLKSDETKAARAEMVGSSFSAGASMSAYSIKRN